MKTSELTGAALDWAVAKCFHDDEFLFGPAPYLPDENGQPEYFQPSTYWAQGGPIIERAVVSLGVEDGGWRALCWGMDGPNRELYSMRGPTPLIAAMRCFVASRLGDEVDIPEEL
jgi:hypothetical protein